MNYYKLTNQNMQTQNDFQWELGKRYSIDKPDKGKVLCSDGWFHCYSHPLLAILLNPIHSDIDNPRLFEIEVGGLKREDGGLKFGFTEMTLVKEIDLPELTITQLTAMGILCVKKVYSDEQWNRWANGWLSGENRSFGTATRIANTTYAAAYAATNATVRDAAAAGYAAVYAAQIVHAAYAADAAAHAAAHAAYTADAAHVVIAIIHAAYAVDAASTGAYTAANVEYPLDLVELIEKAKREF